MSVHGLTFEEWIVSEHCPADIRARAKELGFSLDSMASPREWLWNIYQREHTATVDQVTPASVNPLDGDKMTIEAPEIPEPGPVKVGGRWVEGVWPANDPRRAFVEGAKWWEYEKEGATMRPSDRRLAEVEAQRRFEQGDWPATGDTETELIKSEKSSSRDALCAQASKNYLGGLCPACGCHNDKPDGQNHAFGCMFYSALLNTP